MPLFLLLGNCTDSKGGNIPKEIGFEETALPSWASKLGFARMLELPSVIGELADDIDCIQRQEDFCNHEAEALMIVQACKEVLLAPARIFITDNIENDGFDGFTPGELRSREHGYRRILDAFYCKTKRSLAYIRLEKEENNIIDTGRIGFNISCHELAVGSKAKDRFADIDTNSGSDCSNTAIDGFYPTALSAMARLLAILDEHSHKIGILRSFGDDLMDASKISISKSSTLIFPIPVNTVVYQSFGLEERADYDRLAQLRP